MVGLGHGSGRRSPQRLSRVWMWTPAVTVGSDVNYSGSRARQVSPHKGMSFCPLCSLLVGTTEVPSFLFWLGISQTLWNYSAWEIWLLHLIYLSVYLSSNRFFIALWTQEGWFATLVKTQSYCIYFVANMTLALTTGCSFPSPFVSLLWTRLYFLALQVVLGLFYGAAPPVVDSPSLLVLLIREEF